MIRRFSHKTIFKTLVLTVAGLVLLVQVQLFAAKGDAKAKKGYVLKFNGFELKGLNNPSSTLRLNGTYKGSFNTIEKNPQQTTLQSIITYQKGNTTFIYPYRHQVSVPKFKTPERPKF